MCRFRRLRTSHDKSTRTNIRTCHTRGAQRVHGHVAGNRRRRVRRLLRDRASSYLCQEVSAESRAGRSTVVPHRMQYWTTTTLLTCHLEQRTQHSVLSPFITACSTAVFFSKFHSFKSHFHLITSETYRNWFLLIVMFRYFSVTPQTQHWNRLFFIKYSDVSSMTNIFMLTVST